MGFEARSAWAPRRGAVGRFLTVLVLVIVGEVTACSSAAVPASDATVRLVAASPEMVTECRSAATRLGFAVPCPTIVPETEGKPLACPASQVPADAQPCIALSGLPATPDFFVNWTGFDVGPDYRGVGGKRAGHFIIEASPERESASQPCIGDSVAHLSVAKWAVTEYRCSGDSRRVEAAALHGEGAHLGHVLLAWTFDGIDYVVSAHGTTSVNVRLLEQLISSIRLVGP